MNTEIKHTLGPWELHPSYADAETREVPEGDGTAFMSWSTYIRSEHNEKITCEALAWTTKTGGWPRVDKRSEMLANAHLIAAAPELLKALKAARDSIFQAAQDVPNWYIDAGCVAYEDLEDAIAKAEGNQ